MSTPSIVVEAGWNGQDVYVSDPNWIMGFEDLNVQFGIYAKVNDRLDAGMEDAEGANRFCITFDIVPHDPPEDGAAFSDHEREWLKEYQEKSPEETDEHAAMRREVVVGYGSTASCTRFLMGISGGGEKLPTPVGAFVEADQWGPTFEEESDASAYAKAVLTGRASAMGMMIGFCLDRPQNQMGWTGWKFLEENFPQLKKSA
jgi:hypothetical protein